MPIPLYKPGPSLPDRSGSDPFLSGPAFDSSKMDTNAMSFKASRNGLKISSISRRALKTFTPAAKDEQYSEKPASGFNKSSIDKSRAYNGKPAPFPMLNLAYINQCAGWPGNPVNPPTPLSHPPTPLACPPTNTAATPLTSSSFGFGPDGSPISKDRVVPNKPNIAALRMARMDGQRDMLSPFALPLYQPQKYMAYNLDTANTKIPAPTAPLSPPPTPIAKNSVTSPKAKLTPASKQPAILEDSKPVPDPRSISSKYLAERKVLPAFNAQYDMLDELGSGGFGFVIRAKRRCDGLIVAVKFIYRERVSHAINGKLSILTFLLLQIPSHGWVRARGWTKMPDGRPNPSEKLVPMEAYVLRMVRHKGVVAFLDLMEDENTFYLVMEHHGTPWLLPDESEDEGRLLTSPSADGLAKTPEASYSELSVSPVSSLGPSTPVSPTPPNRLAPPPMLRRSSCDLFECIEQHSRLSEDQARYVFGQIVDVVYHLASMGICHRKASLILSEECLLTLSGYRRHQGRKYCCRPELPCQAHRFWFSNHFRRSKASSLPHSLLWSNLL